MLILACLVPSNEPASMSLDGRIISASIVGFEKRYDHEHNKVRVEKIALEIVCAD